HAARRAEHEVRQPHHDRTTDPTSDFWLLTSDFLAVPSPPSHGGATRIGSGHAMAGKCAGPNRGARPLAFASSALTIFSGVIGTSSIRTPIASYTALATAGITGRSGPCPTSFAPNGPRGSGFSTSSVITSGMSSVV